MSDRVGYRWLCDQRKLRGTPGRTVRPLPTKPQTAQGRLMRGWQFVRIHLLPFWLLWAVRQQYRILRAITPGAIQDASLRLCRQFGLDFGEVRLQMRATLIDRRETHASGWALPLLAGNLLLHWSCRRLGLSAGSSGRVAGRDLWMRAIEQRALRITERLGQSRPHWVAAAAYRGWSASREPDVLAIQRQRELTPAQGVTISILSVVYETRADPLLAFLNTVMQQSYTRWQLILVDATAGGATGGLLRAACLSNPRVTVISQDPQLGPAALLDRAFDLATGEYHMVLDVSDRLAPSCLHTLAAAVSGDPGCDLCYADEDWIDRDELRSRPHCKPGYSLETLRSYDYIGRPCLSRRSIVQRVGGYRQATRAAAEYDLTLRICEQTHHVLRVPQVLYHWRRKDCSGSLKIRDRWVRDATSALTDHLTRSGEAARVLPGQFSGAFEIRYVLARRPRVSIVIPNRDQREILRACINSILDLTDYEDYEILIVENGSRQAGVFEDYQAYQSQHPQRVRVVTFEGPFNFSEVINYGVEQATGSLVLLLNNDTEIIHASWLERMCALAMRPGVGAVGAKLYFSSGAVQHGGVVVGLGGAAGHPHRHCPGNAAGHMGRLGVTAEISAVSGACLLLDRELFRELGGLDPAYPLAFNDIDLCLRIRAAGYRVIWTPHVQLYHHESLTRGADVSPEDSSRARREVALFQRHWGRLIRRGDPFYSPNLTLASESVMLKQDWEDAHFSATVPDTQRALSRIPLP